MLLHRSIVKNRLNGTSMTQVLIPTSKTMKAISHVILSRIIIAVLL